MDADRSETVHSLPLNIQPSNSLSLSLSLSSIVTSEDVSRRFFLNREKAPSPPAPGFLGLANRWKRSLLDLGFLADHGRTTFAPVNYSAGNLAR